MSQKIISTEELHSIFLSCGQKVCTDTRKIEKGALFFALKGENFDGNKYAGKAIEEGCGFAVIDNPKEAIPEKTLLVNDVLKSLQDLANFHRKKFTHPVIAITGSNGKTTTKELIKAVLSKKYSTLATVGNLNNHIGVPLTLLSLTKEHEIAIIEMGANHQSEIKALCEIAEPDYGLITNIGKAHLEGFGGFDGVKKGKGELYDYLRGKKTEAFVNSDDPILHDMAVNNDKISYGTTKLYDVVGKFGDSTGMIEFKWKTRYTATALASAPFIKTNLVGKYNLNNLLCAATVGNYFHVEEEKINEALSQYVPENNRSQLFNSDNNKLILDMYNANPSSMLAAIENFAGMKEENKLLILGDMLELGTESAKEHSEIIDLLKKKNLNDCILVGPEFYSYSSSSGFNHFKNVSEAAAHLKQHPVKNKIILLKGSRGIKLEELLPAL
ncbi:MAG: UDP-N-acetylmuramoyl-tripeptide--D-alanyl-D-alanine ligase [Bacteroidia bacterium]|nr:UDP-N-acetylmuramoyl-tripeptide--D-alanyl-D-alanine ligase [Bacteroidia bacterium]